MSVPLAKDETIVAEESFRTSLIWQHLKANFQITNRRFMGESRNYLLGLIPTGTNTVTYPLKNIASVSSSTNTRIGALLFGVVLVLMGLASISNSVVGALVLIAIGAVIAVQAICTVIAVTNNSGQTVALPVLFFEREAAMNFVTRVNTLLAERAD